ncbi:MAG: transporter [Planctomycetota bacterium]
MTFELTIWDWGVIAFYFAFIVGIGFLFRRVNRNSSDYFRGGGNMLWWMAGMSAIISGISTWSFTGAAAKVYDSGFLLPLAWFLGTLIQIPVLWYMAPRFRQMRVVTSVEAICRRFGFGTEQFYTYLVLPMGLFWGGIGLNTVAVFMSAALNIDMTISLIGLGVIVTVMAMAGGQWAVAASDFVQGVMLFLIVSVVIFATLRLPEIGGLANMFAALPERQTDFTYTGRLAIIWLWLITMQISTLFYTLNMQGEGAKYLLVKNGRQARGMIVMRFVLSAIIPLMILMQLPALCAAVVFPSMAEVFPNLKIPEEGAFVAMAFYTLPQGLIGLLICGMFAASMSSMDTALNRNAGFFVRNIYIKYLNRRASEENQVRVGKVFTGIFGGLVILIGLMFDSLRDINLFDIFLLLNSMVLVPTVVPVALGVVIKKTPSWSGWSTVLVGVAVGAIAKGFYSPERFARVMGYLQPLTDQEIIDSRFVFISLAVIACSSVWFLVTRLFYERSGKAHRESVDAFFTDMSTPIDPRRERIEDQDAMQYRLVSLICLGFGGFVLLGVFIPNALFGRLAFLYVGGVMVGIGVVLAWVGRRAGRSGPPSMGDVSSRDEGPSRPN